MTSTDATMIRTFLESLDRTERLVLTLLYGEQLTTHETSLVLDLPEPRIRAIAEAIRERIRVALAAGGVGAARVA
jgi:DNA-directed RNA polymerase specialized sigma24 family protein